MVDEKGVPFVAGFLSVASPGSDMAVCRGTLNATKSSIRGEEDILPIMPLEMLRLLVFFSFLSEAPSALYLGFFALSSPLLPPPCVNFPLSVPPFPHRCRPSVFVLRVCALPCTRGTLGWKASPGDRVVWTVKDAGSDDVRRRAEALQKVRVLGGDGVVCWLRGSVGALHSSLFLPKVKARRNGCFDSWR